MNSLVSPHFIIMTCQNSPSEVDPPPQASRLTKKNPPPPPPPPCQRQSMGRCLSTKCWALRFDTSMYYVALYVIDSSFPKRLTIAETQANNQTKKPTNHQEGHSRGLGAPARAEGQQIQSICEGMAWHLQGHEWSEDPALWAKNRFQS